MHLGPVLDVGGLRKRRQRRSGLLERGFRVGFGGHLWAQCGLRGLGRNGQRCELALVRSEAFVLGVLQGDDGGRGLSSQRLEARGVRGGAAPCRGVRGEVPLHSGEVGAY